VPADNNACERALRPSVIHRKVMGSFRSDWGAQTYAALATVLNTAKPNGENTFQKLVQLMGPPVLPFLLLPASGVRTVTIIILITWRSK
jgi:transposase